MKKTTSNLFSLAIPALDFPFCTGTCCHDYLEILLLTLKGSLRWKITRPTLRRRTGPISR